MYKFRKRAYLLCCMLLNVESFSLNTFYIKHVDACDNSKVVVKNSCKVWKHMRRTLDCSSYGISKIILKNRISDNTQTIELHDIEENMEEGAYHITSNNSLPLSEMKNQLTTMTLPLLLIWFSNPLLSLIDTCSVGQVSSVDALASLGPATAICDIGTYIFSFISILTTKLVSSSLARNNKTDATHNVNDALTVSFILGTIISGSVLSPFGETILKVYLGGTSLSDEASILIPSALKYMRIRALGFVPTLMASQIQCSLIARKNVYFPLKTVAISGIVNIVGDFILVICCKMGISGAAWATVLAQIVTFNMLLDSKYSGEKVDFRKPFTRIIDSLQFTKQCISPAFAMFGRAGISLIMSYYATSCGNIAIATHQIVYGCFALFCPIGEAVGQTIMNILPSYILQNEKFDNKRVTPIITTTSHSLISVMGKTSILIGCINAFLAMVTSVLMSKNFTSSTLVQENIVSVIPFMGLSLTIHTIACLFEGILFTIGETRFLGTVYVINMLSVSAIFSFMNNSLNLTQIWMIYTGSIITRFFQFFLRYLWKQNKTSTITI